MLAVQRCLDARGCIAPHRPAAAPAVKYRGPRKQQLQVIVELGHGADGGARGSHRICLVDGDRGRNSVDAVDLRLIHPIQELTGVGGEGLYVAALALGVQCVESERGGSKGGIRVSLQGIVRRTANQGSAQRPANCSIMSPVPPRVTCATMAVRRWILVTKPRLMAKASWTC